MPPVEPNDEERLQEQTNDVATPFQPADDASPAPAADDTHPATDTDVDSDELYQEGVNSATNAPAPDDPTVDKEDVSDLSDGQATDNVEENSDGTIEDKSL